MRFGPVIDDVIKYGHTAKRECWPDGFEVGLKLPDDKSDLTGAYFYQTGFAEDHCLSVPITVPWTPDTFDMTAHDWIINEK